MCVSPRLANTCGGTDFSFWTNVQFYREYFFFCFFVFFSFFVFKNLYFWSIWASFQHIFGNNWRNYDMYVLGADESNGSALKVVRQPELPDLSNRVARIAIFAFLDITLDIINIAKRFPRPHPRYSWESFWKYSDKKGCQICPTRLPELPFFRHKFGQNPRSNCYPLRCQIYYKFMSVWALSLFP